MCMVDDMSPFTCPCVYLYKTKEAGAQELIPFIMFMHICVHYPNWLLSGGISMDSYSFMDIEYDCTDWVGSTDYVHPSRDMHTHTLTHAMDNIQMEG